ncbi:hypothetical protein L1F06_014270 [Ectopseudomonas hydrolytica]|uniref:Uncharacterized protein n=1 Tax=Ectopseudomonas hydrolytica TaxID=2493633 RepID=A0ABY5A2E2_9GAMM|nr:hypothetical protein [Pseudomonas hydrolytica]USR37841.1 hypothetical protein L1F06_014270 [Pseudomonas hydrolytica]
MDKKPNRTGFLAGQLTFGDDFDTLGQTEIKATFEGEPEPAPCTEPCLATKEGEGQRCQVCGFPATAGHVQGVVDGERYSLLICPGCLKHAVLCLRDSHRQCRLFDDDFEIEELCRFGKAPPTHGGEEKDWQQMKPVGREFGADHDD